ncbi:amidase [Ideonella sp. A 288]|uniref:amidase n=1 Tax=Ideonella sp. A 288 TaxID=1962181 RepID=UPI000B4B52F3|nr:amidase [Ideonella sp. A 288]
MSSLAYLPAHELARRLRRRELSAVELLQLYLGRVERHGPALNAVVVRDAERALRRARQADEALARGECWGPLHGLPMTVKESFNVAGLPTTFGFEAFRDNIAQTDAVTVQRLTDAGAVVFGKTNVPVSLADWQTFNPVYGTTNNPWDTARGPGGSSGGSAAALAAGLTALELGSDIGASIRNPAHYCGVYGHKPTWGVVPIAGHQLADDEVADTFDIAAVGPLARSAYDLSLAMDILAHPLESQGPMGRVPLRWRDSGVPPQRCRVAVLWDDAQAEVDESVRAPLRALAAFLRDRGLQVSETDRPVDSAEANHVYLHLLRAATGSQLGDADYGRLQALARDLRPDEQDYRARAYRGSTLSHRDWHQLDQRREHLRRQWGAFFERYDLLICPVATTPAFHHNQQGERWERLIPVNGHGQPTTDALFWAGYPGIVGLPATAFPLGLTAEGLPVGAQIVGPAFADPLCLRFAQWLEREYHAFVAPPGWGD